jgi:DNA-directed RNA polymerase subunit RPC12/RpoP
MEEIEFFELSSFANGLKSINGLSAKIREIDDEAKRKNFNLSPGKLDTFEYPEKIVCSCGAQFAIPDRTDIIICPVCNNKIDVLVKTEFFRREYSSPEDVLIFTNIEISASKPTVVVGDVKAKENVIVIHNLARRFRELRERKEKLEDELWKVKEEVENNVDYKILTRKIYNFFYKNSSLIVKFGKDGVRVTFSEGKIQVDTSSLPGNYDKNGIRQDIIDSLFTIKNYFEE